MITYYFRSAKDNVTVELEKSRDNAWVYVEKPTEKELVYLQDTFSLDEGMLRDALDAHEVPRIEIEDGIMYLFTRFVFSKDDQIVTAPLLIVSTQRQMITISPEHFPGLPYLLSSKAVFTTTRHHTLFFQLLSQIQATYYQHLNTISKRVRILTTTIEKIKNRDIVQFVTYENILHEFNSALIRINTIFTSLLYGKIVIFTEGEKDTIEDFSLENEQLIEITKESLRSIANIREAYSTIMTNNLNRVIKLFTSLTVILTIPTIIASLYGMNVALPFEKSPSAFMK